MNTKRTIGTLAALGGITATIALLTGLPSAKADELADLRANQELLQRRLDQLAQAPISPAAGLYPGGPAAATAGQGIVGGSFPRSFLIPGTDTSLRVGGEVRMNALYWMTGGNPNSVPQTTNSGATGQVEGIPLKVHVPSTAAFTRDRSGQFIQLTPYQSKMNVETRTPTAWGEARTFIEFDFSQVGPFVPGGSTTRISDSVAPRFRFAYGTLGGWLAGQANSNFSDPDANGETLDFGGNLGEPGIVRLAQLRYTAPLAPYGIPGAFSMSVETPQSGGWTPASGVIESDQGAGAGLATTTTTINPFTGTAVTESAVLTGAFLNPFKSPIPNFTWAWYIPQPWGHMDFSSVLRFDQLKDGAYVDRTFAGYGVHFGGDVKPGWFGWAKDDIIFHFVYGNGIASYLNASPSGFGLVTNYPVATPPTPAAGALVQARETVEYGGEIGYQHWWMPNLRSNINAGFMWHDIPTNLRTITSATTSSGLSAVCAGGTTAAATGAGGCGLNKFMWTGHANLIWNPVPFVDVGVEYMYGHRQTVSNVKGDENVLLTKFGVKF